MHELSIANAILDSVRAEGARHPGARFVKVGVRVGELSGVAPDALHFCFDALVADSALAPLALEIEWRPRRQKCLECDRVFNVADFDITCPDCGAPETRCIGGDELEMVYLEMEDHEQAAVGKESPE
ncbi:MAG: hydrogenase maturation nickel metallochaperone HypA [Terriglobia bacterium]